MQKQRPWQRTGTERPVCHVMPLPPVPVCSRALQRCMRSDACALFFSGCQLWYVRVWVRAYLVRYPSSLVPLVKYQQLPRPLSFSSSLSLSLSFHLVPPSISDIDKIVVSLTVYLTFRSWSKQTGRLLRSVTLINYLGRRSIRWKSTVTDPTKKIPVFSRYPPLFEATLAHLNCPHAHTLTAHMHAHLQTHALSLFLVKWF